MKELEFNISGITCMACVSTLEKALYSNSAIEQVSINQEDGQTSIKGESLPHKDVIADLIRKAGSYEMNATKTEVKGSILYRYKPILLVGIFLLGVTLLIEWNSGMFLLETWMPNFMAGFFLTFSFFKLLDIKGFANAYQSYDIIARKAKVYGYVYPFIELGLGLAYLLYPDNDITHLVTAVVMFVSLIGVVQAVLGKSEIKCACLGTVFNLPMSTVTIVEDALMLAMALFMYLN